VCALWGPLHGGANQAVIEMLEEAFRSSQLTLKEAHPELDSVAVEAFSGREDDIFRAVHFFRDNGLFFSREGKNFRNINRLLRQGQIASVKRLMVYQNKDELDDPRSQRLVRFHSNTKGYSYRIIAAKHFQSILVRNRLPTSGDFGLYGRHYVYEVVKNPSRRVVAIWSWDPAKVSSFTETFEACWKSTYSNELSGKLGGRILVRDLFHEK
jgi:hypothetical protein